MKEETWSIRKMREDRKHSTLRNTYKQNEDEVVVGESSGQKKEPNSSLDRIFKGFMLFLEE